jgi:hypothetical protein
MQPPFVTIHTVLHYAATIRHWYPHALCSHRDTSEWLPVKNGGCFVQDGVDTREEQCLQ